MSDTDLVQLAIDDVKELNVCLDTEHEKLFALIRAWMRGYQCCEERDSK